MDDRLEDLLFSSFPELQEKVIIQEISSVHDLIKYLNSLYEGKEKPKVDKFLTQWDIPPIVEIVSPSPINLGKLLTFNNYLMFKPPSLARIDVLKNPSIAILNDIEEELLLIKGYFYAAKFS